MSVICLFVLFHTCDFRTEEEEKAVGAVYCEKMDELLKKSDFVMVVVNLSPQTQKLIGAKELAMMKPSSTLINISRGKHLKARVSSNFCVHLLIYHTLFNSLTN